MFLYVLILQLLFCLSSLPLSPQIQVILINEHRSIGAACVTIHPIFRLDLLLVP